MSAAHRDILDASADRESGFNTRENETKEKYKSGMPGDAKKLPTAPD
jgi:hypothetical protein